MANKKEFYKWVKISGFALFIPSLLAAGPLGGYFVGSFLENRFHLPGYTTFVFTVIGLAAGMLETYRIIRKMVRVEEKL